VTGVETAATGWSAFRIPVVVLAGFSGRGFLARAIRAFVQRRRLTRIAGTVPSGAP